MVTSIGQPNQRRISRGTEGVSPGEVEEAIYSRPRWTDKGRDGTRLVHAYTCTGRPPFVVSESMDGRDLVVTARDLTRHEKRTLREKGRWPDE